MGRRLPAVDRAGAEALGWPSARLDAFTLGAGDQVLHIGAHAIVVRTRSGALQRYYREALPDCWIAAAREWSSEASP